MFGLAKAATLVPEEVSGKRPKAVKSVQARKIIRKIAMRAARARCGDRFSVAIGSVH
jgi:hypothetical protein